MVEGKANEALRKLKDGIEESKQMVRLKSMGLAQEYFTDSVKALKQKMEESRSILEGLPGQIPGAEEGPFQMMFLELMNNYAAIEESLEKAEKNVAALDMEEVAEQGELDATDASRREASKLGVDLTQVKGTGTGGRIIISDVMEAAEENAKNKAEELGVNTEEVEGSGFNGMVTADDVIRFAESAGIEPDQEAEVAEKEAGVEQAVVTEPIPEPVVADAEPVEAGIEELMEAEAVQIAEEEAALAAQVAEDAIRLAEEAAAVQLAVEEEAAQVTEAAEVAQAVAAEQAVQVAEETEVAQIAAVEATKLAEEAARAAQATRMMEEEEAVQAMVDELEAQGAVEEEVSGSMVAEAAGPDGQGNEQEQEAPQATNAALRKAKELAVDLDEIQGTGVNGLITVRDVVRA